NGSTDFCLWPRIAVLVNLYVVKPSRLGAGRRPRPTSRSLGLHECLRTALRKHRAVAVKRCFVVLLHPPDVGRQILEGSHRGLSTRLSGQQEGKRGSEYRPQEAERPLSHGCSPYSREEAEPRGGECRDSCSIGSRRVRCQRDLRKIACVFAPRGERNSSCGLSCTELQG